MDQVPIDHIIQGNCIDVLQTFPSTSIDLIFADPPEYHHQTGGDNVDDDRNQGASVAEYDSFTEAWLRECRRVLSDEGTIWVIGSTHTIFRVGKIMMDLGFWILNDVLWYKTNPMPNLRGKRFQHATETLIWAKKSSDQRSYTFNYHAMKHLNDDKQMSNVWHIPICAGAERVQIHGRNVQAIQKPEALLYRVILSSSNPGDIVLDPFFGTGTTGAVAKKLKRRYIGIEQNAAYIQAARARIEHIPDSIVADPVLVTPSKRTQPRVSFDRLVEAQYINVGQLLYSKDRRVSAMVTADSTLLWGTMRGSIHKIAALAQQKPSWNGWEYWYCEDRNGTLISIDELRERYRRERLMRSSDGDLHSATPT